MLGANLREKLSKPVYKVGELIAKTNVNPNIFTISGIFVAAIAAYFLVKQQYLPALIFIIFSAAWDGIDGSIARAQGKKSKWGNYLDALIDKYVEIIIYLGFALGGFAIESFLVITGSMILSYAKPRTAIVVPIDNHDWPAIGERADRLLFLIISMLAGIFLPQIKILAQSLPTISVLLYVLAGIVYIGSVQRMLYARKIIKAGGTSNMSIKQRRE
mgnify:CR=1 FL=1